MSGTWRTPSGCARSSTPAWAPRPTPRWTSSPGWVRRTLGVPVALVSLVRAEQQVLPGMAGLSEPWATTRALPLGHTFCRHIVTTARPLVLADARRHPLHRDTPAGPELGVVAYAGVPVTDEAGNVLGALSAVDTEARSWTDDQLATLRDIAPARPSCACA